jgi:hypothetical protein
MDDNEEEGEEEQKINLRGSIVKKIVSCLLKYDDISIGAIADCAGYHNIGLRKTDYVKRPLENLIELGFVKKNSPQDNQGRQGRSIYRLSRDLTVLNKLYHNETFAEHRNEFRQSVWLRELIVQERFNDSGLPKNSDILEMLMNSQSFFEFLFSPLFSIKDLFSIAEMVKTCPIVRYDHCGKVVATENSENIQSAVYNVFISLAFIDYWHDKQNDTGSSPLRECVNKMREKLFAINKNIQDFNATLDYMRAIISFDEAARAGKDSDELKRALQYYKHDLDFYARTTQKDDIARRKVDSDYDKISTILNLNVKRRV